MTIDLVRGLSLENRLWGAERIRGELLKLTAQGTALTKSEQARTAAEGRAHAAIASLRELAQVKEAANETIVALSGAVLFKTDESTLLPLAEHALEQVADAVEQLDASRVVLIEGYTDSRGAEDMNRKLSQARADESATPGSGPSCASGLV